jgi:hypothetical protein
MGEVLELRPQDDCVVRASGGGIDSPFSYDYRTHLPEVGGLACPEVWGPVPWTGVLDSDIPNDPRRDGIGHIALPEAIPHPLDATVALRNVPVIAPGHRGFVRLDPQTSRSRLIAMRDALLSQSEEPHRKMLGELGLWDDEQDRPLTDAQIAELAPIDEESALDRAYRGVVNHARSLAKLQEYGAPHHVLDEVRVQISNAVAELFHAIDSASLPDAVRDAARATCLLEPR